MIRNQEQLELVRRQLGHLEASLQDLENDVRPKSESWFTLMSEAYVAEIAKLRAEIEDLSGRRMGAGGPKDPVSLRVGPEMARLRRSRSSTYLPIDTLRRSA